MIKGEKGREEEEKGILFFSTMNSATRFS